ncbi:MAG: hypothetical protein FK733_07055 [Asgard group archaeon]|nr:hypothetical protein [Asgard group archaeon]
MIKLNKLWKGAIHLFVLSIILMLFFVSIQKSSQIYPNKIDEEIIKQDEFEMYEKIGGWNDDYGEITDIFVRDNIAFITSDGYLMLIVNVTDKSSPVLIGTLPFTAGSTSSIYVDGDYAVIGIQYAPHYTCLVDISNLTSPQLISYFYHIGHAEDVYIEDQFVYIVDLLNGTHIYDISNTEMPELVSIYDFGDDARRLFVEGNYMYICDAHEGHHIVDISKKHKPKLTGFMDFGSTDVYIVGNDLYLVLTTEQIYIYDITDKSQPVLQTFFGHGMNSKLIVRGNFAYVSDHLHGLKIYSIANFFAISETGSYFDGGLSPSMFLEGNYLYFCEEMDGVLFLDISDPSNPTKIGEFDLGTGSEAYRLEKEGDLIYMSDDDDGLEVIDVSDPTNPIQIMEFDDNNPVFDIELIDDIAIISNGELGILFLNLSDYLDIVYLINPPGFTYALKVIDDLLFADDGYYGVFVYNITDITAPVLLSNFNPEGYSVFNFHLENDVLFMACDSGLLAYNMTNQSDPFRIGNYSGYYTPDMEMQNNLAYTVAFGAGLVVYNISDPTNITLHYTYDIPMGLTSINLDNNIAYITVETYYYCNTILLALNVSDLESTNFVGQYLSDQGANDVIVEDNLAYLSVSENGLVILNLSSVVPIPADPCPQPPPITLTPSPPPETANGYYLIAILTILPSIYLIRKRYLLKKKNN